MRRWWLVVAVAGALALSRCATELPPTLLPVVPPPPTARTIIVIGLAANPDSEIYVERPWGGGYAEYDRVTVADLRAMAFHRLSAERRQEGQ